MQNMTPQELVATLLGTQEEQGRALLQHYMPLFSDVALDRLVYLLKREADHCWYTRAQLSLTLSGYLLLLGDLTHDLSYHALGLMARGDALRRLDRDQEALPFFDAAGEEFLSLGDEVGWARTRIGRVNACLRLNRTTEALRDASQAHAIFIRYGKLVRAGQIDVNAAIINFELGQYEQAVRLFDRALDTYQRHGEGVDLHIARAQGNKALTLAALGKFRAAAALHDQARAMFETYGESEEIAVAREELNIADISAAQGYYSKALLLYNQSRAVFQKRGLEGAAGEVALQMCHCLVRLNRTREAYDLAAETSEAFRDSPGQRHNLARALVCQADAATFEGRQHEADELLRQAAQLLDAGGFVRLAALTRLRRAELYFANGQVENSLHEAQYLAELFTEQENLPDLARTLLLLARLADKRGEIAAAVNLCRRTLDIVQQQELLAWKYLCYDLLGQLAVRGGDLEAAASYYDWALLSIDEVQSRLVLDERTSFLEDKGGIYQRAISLALQRGDVDQALIYIEKSKSCVLGDYLRNTIDIRLRAGDSVGAAILEDLARLREEQAWYSSIVYSAGDEANLSDTAVTRLRAIGPTRARTEMQQRERRIERLLEQVQLRSAGDLVAGPRAPWGDDNVTSLGSRLAPDTLLLEYYLADQDLHIFSFSREAIAAYTVPQALPRLERLFSLWRANLELAGQAAGSSDRAQAFSGLLENSQGLSQRLYNLLLGPLTEQFRHYQRLVIVPYGLLHYLPFHCLFDGTGFLGEHLEISYLPASSLLEICRQRGERNRVAQGDLARSLVLGLSDGGRLPYAVQEAELVAQQLGASPTLNDAATVALLEEKGAYSPIVHIAAHGLFRLDAPNFSAIKLARGQLSAIDVFNLDLSACSLVVLSACETGRAVIKGVDEVIGLGRGFLYAGAASLLPTLWKVDDASSAELMAMFYQALLRGQTKAAALASAQRAFLARARSSHEAYRLHPYFWAAFHLIGDAGPLLVE
jgi:CHAT domain-containing protein